jgi:hypothetical protein
MMLVPDHEQASAFGSIHYLDQASPECRRPDFTAFIAARDIAKAVDGVSAMQLESAPIKCANLSRTSASA